MSLLIIANWKCNPTTLKEAEHLFSALKSGIKKTKQVEVVICPPFVYLGECHSQQIGSTTSNLQLGA
jgi:triosephosphate isomerase